MHTSTRLRHTLELAVILALVVLAALMLTTWQPANAAMPTAAASKLADCVDGAFSTEQRFVTHGPLPTDGIPTISDGDLLSPRGEVCLRNRELLAAFNLPGIPTLPDLGLDASDILDLERPVIAFSTEIDDPLHRFTEGDLLTTTGAVIPNAALMAAFGVGYDVGLDEVKFTGRTKDIVAFLDLARQIPRDQWLANPGRLRTELERYDIDLWFSIEETAQRQEGAPLLDGDILSARTGSIVASQDALFNPSIPGGLPTRGVDFGLDAFAVRCDAQRDTIRFSAEIVYRDQPALTFSDGDLLKLGGSVLNRNNDFIAAFKPNVKDLGLDAIAYPADHLPCSDTQRPFLSFLPLILRNFRLGGSQ